MSITQKHLELLPCWRHSEVLRPGARVGKGGNPHHYLVDGIKCRRVTSILERTIPKGRGFNNWLVETGIQKMTSEVFEAEGVYEIDGVECTLADWLNYTTELARVRPDEVRDEAADWGTRAHAVIQQYIDLKIAGMVLTYVAEEMQPTIRAFSDFEVGLDVTWLATEMVVWDEQRKVAGSVDAIGYSPKGWVIADWKTSKGHYPESSLQLSAYAAMFKNITGQRISHGYVVRFPKDRPDEGPAFHVERVANLRTGWARYKELIRQTDYQPWAK